ncbi:hypothetical protein PG993_010675 [Apiospora rasikravindrae]|uniref:Uncharacterized protein n=1 Tax=Apiospora rasikravindrae TaxID=990691 RepID=A0ABR1SMZ0_9PEZI
MVAVHDRLLACRDTIEHLDLRAYLAGCTEWPGRWNLPFPLAGSNGSRGERQQDDTSISHYYPTLKPLKLEGYEFDQSDLADLQPMDQDYLWWIQSGRFWRLFTAALSQEARLESLVWTDPSWDPAALGPILDPHGTSLRRLGIWSHEPRYSEYSDSTKAALNVSQIQHIAQGAPNLHYLALNVYRSGNVDGWPWYIFEAVTSLPQLVSADVWLELAADCIRDDPTSEVRPSRRRKAGEEYQRPMFNLLLASDIFPFMREKVGPVKLERVTFWAGDWERAWDGPIYKQSWVEGRKVRVECDVLGQLNDGPRTEGLEGMCKFTVDQTGGWLFSDADELGFDGVGLPYTIAT